MKKLVIYIAGPYRGRDAWQVEKNIRDAEDVSFHVLSRGHVPIAPHLLCRHFDRTLPDDVFLSGDLELLLRCDAMFVLPNYQSSKGTAVEIDFAGNHGKHVIYLKDTHVLSVANAILDLEFEIEKGAI